VAQCSQRSERAFGADSHRGFAQGPAGFLEWRQGFLWAKLQPERPAALKREIIAEQVGFNPHGPAPTSTPLMGPNWGNLILMPENIGRLSKRGTRLHIPSVDTERTAPSSEGPISRGWIKHRIGAKILIDECWRHFNEFQPQLWLAPLTAPQFKKTRSIKTLARAIS
jgi:hypothetical protein